MSSILVVDDEKTILTLLQAMLVTEEYDVKVACDTDEASLILAENNIDVVISDIVLPKLSGVEFLKKVKHLSPRVHVILMTGSPTVESAAEAVRAGAFDYLTKPIDKEEFLKTVASAARLKSIEDEARRLAIENRMHQENLESLVDERTAALKKSEEKYRTILSTMEEALYEIDLQGNFTYFNDSLCRFLGRSRDDLSALNFRHYMSEESATAVLEESRHVLKTGVPEKSTEWTLYRGDGTSCVVQGSISLLTDSDGKPIGFRGILTDISERKIAEAVKEEYSARSVGVIEHSVESIITVDNRGIIESINPAAITLFGYQEDEIIGESVNRLIPESYWDKYPEILNVGNETSPPTLLNPIQEIEGVRKNGTTFPFRLGVSNVIFADRKVYAWMIHDLTRESELEQQLLQARKLESLGTLARGIAHDLNNILAPISMSTTVLQSEKLTDSGAHLLETIEEATALGMDMVKQVLTFARVTEGTMTRVPTLDVIQEIVKFMSRVLPKNIRLGIQIPDDLWAIWGDATQLHQILLNLCVNARDAMPNGGNLNIQATNSLLDDTSSAKHIDARPIQYVSILVSDTGTGISEENMTRIFDPFFTTKALGEGTGLGLSTVAGIVKAFGGFIETESKIDEGTNFSIFLPALSVETKSPPRDKTHASRTPVESGKTL